MILPPEAARIHDLLQTNLPFFAETALKIKTKEGKLEAFKFNTAQEYLHSRLEDQKRKTGRVRAIILKGRQQGCSTYVAARYYHRATRNMGQSVFILSHEAETTKKLFRIVERYQTNCPDPLRPNARIATKHEYVFGDIQSDYAIGTAGNENVGRGGTVQLFHGSEVGFWENTDGIQTGVMQSIPDAPDTEVILESTANGMGNMFYEKCMDALEEKGEYILIFIPWFWQEEYRRTPPADWEMTADEIKYMELYGLDRAQMYWKHLKELDFKSKWKFKQEYPANVNEAFQTSTDSYIGSEFIMKARQLDLREDLNAPLVIGVDVGRTKDRTVWTWRRGRKLLKYESKVYDKDEETIQMLIVGRTVQIIKRDQPDKVFIDLGHGHGVHDRLKELGYGKTVTGVNFGGSAINDVNYANKRAEMLDEVRDWIHCEDGPADIPNDDLIHRDFLMLPHPKPTSSGKTLFPTKEMIRAKNGNRSCDILDSCALTFAFPVGKEHNSPRQVTHKQQTSSSLNTLNRLRSGRHLISRARRDQS